MKKNKILILALLVCLSIPVGAQNTDSNITGIVVDKWGNPVYGASVNVAGIPDVRVETDKDGKFEIAADAGRSLQVVTTDKGSTTVKVEHGKAMKRRRRLMLVPTGHSRGKNRQRLYLLFITKILISGLLRICPIHYMDKD